MMDAYLILDDRGALVERTTLPFEEALPRLRELANARGEHLAIHRERRGGAVGAKLGEASRGFAGARSAPATLNLRSARVS